MSSDFHCTESICLEYLADRKQASSLFNQSSRLVNNEIGLIKQNPKIIFCRSSTCFKYFGLDKQKAVSLGNLGIVIGPNGWKKEYLTHELIHHLQFERLGYINAWFSTPPWFMEGMAYSLSKDPRKKLQEPWQTYRKQFNSWYKKVDQESIWEAAEQL